MKIETYGFVKIRPYFSKKWYTDFTGIKLFGAKFLGFSIYNDLVVVNLYTMKNKVSFGIFLYIFFYTICIEFKDPWKGTRYE